MNYIDIIIGLILILGVIRGYCKGVVIECATLVGLVLGIYAAVNYADKVDILLQNWLNISSVTYSLYLSMLVTFVVVIILVFIIGRLFSKFLDAIALGGMNRFLGALVGMVKALSFVFLILLAFKQLNNNYHLINEEDLMKSKFYVPLLAFAENIYETIRCRF